MLASVPPAGAKVTWVGRPTTAVGPAAGGVTPGPTSCRSLPGAADTVGAPGMVLSTTNSHHDDHGLTVPPSGPRTRQEYAVPSVERRAGDGGRERRATAAGGLVSTVPTGEPVAGLVVFSHHWNSAWVTPPLMSSTRALRVRPDALGFTRGRGAVSVAPEVDMQPAGGLVASWVGACGSMTNSHHSE